MYSCLSAQYHTLILYYVIRGFKNTSNFVVDIDKIGNRMTILKFIKWKGNYNVDIDNIIHKMTISTRSNLVAKCTQYGHLLL